MSIQKREVVSGERRNTQFSNLCVLILLTDEDNLVANLRNFVGTMGVINRAQQSAVLCHFNLLRNSVVIAYTRHDTEGRTRNPCHH